MKARWDSKNNKVPRNIPEASHVLVVTLPILIITLRKFGQFSSVIQSCVTLWDPIDCSLPGFPVHHQLLELLQTHVHWVGDAIQPSHPQSSSAPPAFKLSEHQGLIKWVDSLHQVSKVLELLNSESSASNEYLGLIFWGLTGFICLQSKALWSLLIFTDSYPPPHAYYLTQQILWLIFIK